MTGVKSSRSNVKVVRHRDPIVVWSMLLPLPPFNPFSSFPLIFPPAKERCVWPFLCSSRRCWRWGGRLIGERGGGKMRDAFFWRGKELGKIGRRSLSLEGSLGDWGATGADCGKERRYSRSFSAWILGIVLYFKRNNRTHHIYMKKRFIYFWEVHIDYRVLSWTVAHIRSTQFSLR